MEVVRTSLSPPVSYSSISPNSARISSSISHNVIIAASLTTAFSKPGVQGGTPPYRDSLSLNSKSSIIYGSLGSTFHHGGTGTYPMMEIASSRRKEQQARSQHVQPRAAAAKSTPPYNVLVTGSTKGIGLALVRQFLQAGDNVIICSRSAERVEATLKELQAEFGEGRVVGTPCDVSKGAQVEQLAQFAKAQLGKVDIWINNAGSNAYKFAPLVDSDDQSLAEIVETNTLGVMLCCRQAIRLMREQPGGGHVFTMDGAGADGGATPRFAAYGATKRSLAQFTKSLQAELRMLDISKVVVHNLSPGMVTTELLMAGGNTRQAKFFINALAEPPEEVAAYLVPRVREVCSSGRTSSSYIRFLTGPKAYSQILGRLLFKARKDRYLVED